MRCWDCALHSVIIVVFAQYPLCPQSLVNSGKLLNFSKGSGPMIKISLKIYESFRFRDVKFKILCLISEGYQGLVAIDHTKHRAGVI